MMSEPSASSRRIAGPTGALLATIALSIGLAACELGFVDDGWSFVADNRSDVLVLARIKKTVSTATGGETVYEVVEVPASSRLVIATQGFSSGELITAIEMLTESCESIGTFFGWEKGASIQVDDGPTATLVPEWHDQVEPTVEVVNACPVADASPSP